MVQFLNKKTNKIQSFNLDQAQIVLRLDKDLIPIEDKDYYVRGEDGIHQKTSGKNLFKLLGDTNGSLADKKSTEIDMAVRAENSKAGHLFKSFVSNVFLGLDQPLKDQPQTEDEILMEQARERYAGGYRRAGAIAGTLAPLFLGGVGGLFRAGAKTALKAGIKSKGKKIAGDVLSPLGKLPSAQVFKASEAIGKGAKGLAKTAGMGKTGQAMAGAVGTGLGFSAIESSLAGIKASTREFRRPSMKGEKEVNRTMFSALKAGVKPASETFLSTAGIMAGVGGAGLAIKGAVGATKKATGFAPDVLRSKFFKVSESTGGRVNREILNRKIAKKTDSQKVALQKLDKVLHKEGLTKATTRTTLKKNIEDKLTEVGQKIRETRKGFNQVLNKKQRKNARVQLAMILHSMKQTGLGGRTIYKTYNAELEKMMSYILKQNKLKPQDLSEVMEVLTKSAKFAKREGKELGIDKLYRKAYNKVSQFEDDLYKGFKGTDAPSRKLLNSLKEQKDRYSVLKDVDDIVLRSFPPDFKVLQGFNVVRDLAYVGGVGGFAFGSPALGVAGFGAGLALGRASHTGYNFLQIARMIEATNKINIMAKTPLGVNKLLTDRMQAGKIGLPGLGAMFLGKTVNSMSEFSQSLSRLEEWDKTTKGFEDLLGMVGSYGGTSAQAHTSLKINRMKTAILNKMPTPERKQNGKLYYPKHKEKAFFEDVNKWITPQNFISSVQQKNMTEEAYNQFSEIYSNFLSYFNMNFLEAYKNNTLKESANWYKNFIDSLNTSQIDFTYGMLDYSDNPPGGQAPPKRKMPKRQHTISAQAEGGLG